MCYMVADLKYSAEKGVKICEIQQAMAEAAQKAFAWSLYYDPLIFLTYLVTLLDVSLHLQIYKAP